MKTSLINIRGILTFVPLVLLSSALSAASIVNKTDTCNKSYHCEQCFENCDFRISSDQTLADQCRRSCNKAADKDTSWDKAGVNDPVIQRKLSK